MVIINFEKCNPHTSYEIYRKCCDILVVRGHLCRWKGPDAGPEYFYMFMEAMEDLGADKTYGASFITRIETSIRSPYHEHFVYTITFQQPLIGLCYVRTENGLDYVYEELTKYIRMSRNLKRMWMCMYVIFVIFGILMQFFEWGRILSVPICIIVVFVFNSMEEQGGKDEAQ
jgi:hypothetical protein